MKLFVGGLENVNFENALYMFLLEYKEIKDIVNPTIFYAIGVPVIWFWIGEELPLAFKPDYFTSSFEITNKDIQDYFERRDNR